MLPNHCLGYQTKIAEPADVVGYILTMCGIPTVAILLVHIHASEKFKNEYQATRFVYQGCRQCEENNMITGRETSFSMYCAVL